MTNKFFYVLMAFNIQGCIYFGWGNDAGWMGNAALILGGWFAGILTAELLNDGNMK